MLSKDGKALEQLVAFVEEKLTPQGFTVKRGRREYNDNGVQTAEFDIEVRGKVGSSEFSWLIECRDRPSQGPADAAWIRDVAGRRDQYRFNRASAVSTTGFSEGASEAADHFGVDLREVGELDEAELAKWMLVREIEWAQRNARLTTVKLLFNDADLEPVREEVAALLAGRKAGEQILRRLSNNDLLSPSGIALQGIKQAGLFDKAEKTPDDMSFKIQVDIEDEGVIVFDAPSTTVRLRAIYAEGTISVHRAAAGIRTRADYRKLADGSVVSQVVGFGPLPHSDGNHYDLEFHRLADGTHIILRKVQN